jgi:hypothetical protein
MHSAQQTLDRDYLEMRWRCLSLAADLDRIERAESGKAVLASDPRIQRLRQAIAVLLRDEPRRAEAVQNIFSDKTSWPE